ncbi:MAG TPA: cbb3-type cytochrome c oxidase subunit II [Verrucomicrobiae bacterium]|jgi:cytochrome c oxidase cbb3-type subunit 2|nr:cbb3-type cytochrome c oxidase subunit II [Verrucomicrobiae bacterium]
MNNGAFIFLGTLLVMLWSWYGIVVKNFKDITALKPQALLEGGNYPAGRSGTANLGQLTYCANGCAECHTMQVRMKGYGADIERGWGRRNTTLQDFLYDQQVFLGQARVGPDLAGVGNRNPDVQTQLLHLYNPRLTAPGSMMPQYPYLFEKRKVHGRASRESLRLPDNFREAGLEVVPTHEAIALAEYLVSLKADTPIFESPLIPKPEPAPQNTNAPVAGTNAPAGTNAVRG